MGSGAHPRLVSLALARAARAARTDREPCRSTTASGRLLRGTGGAGDGGADRGAPPRAAVPGPVLAAVGHGGRGRRPGSRRWRRASRAGSWSSCRRFSLWLAPLPLLVALAGLLVLGRMRRGRDVHRGCAAFARSADVWWCAAALCAKPLMLVHEALLEPTAVAYWLIARDRAARAAARRSCCCRARIRAWMLVAVGIFVLAADPRRHRLLPVLRRHAVGAGAAGARQTGHVWGRSAVCSRPELLWLLVDCAVRRLARGAAARRGDRHRRSTRTRLLSRPPRRPSSSLAAWRAVGAARARVGAARSDVPRPRGRRAARSVRLSRRTTRGTTRARRCCGRCRPTAQIDEARAWFADRAPLRGRGPVPFGAAARQEPDRRSRSSRCRISSSTSASAARR